MKCMSCGNNDNRKFGTRTVMFNDGKGNIVVIECSVCKSINSVRKVVRKGEGK
jgi:hypothetical protein